MDMHADGAERLGIRKGRWPLSMATTREDISVIARNVRFVGDLSITA